MLHALTLQDPMFVHANLVTPEMESRAMVIIKLKKIKLREDLVILCIYLLLCLLYIHEDRSFVRLKLAP